MNGLDLFSGIGGLTLALSPWVRPVAYCESDKYCTGVLLSRMQSQDLPQAPVWDDVRTLRRQHIDLPIDIIYGGFPCQDISVAGRGKGLDGERSGLVSHVFRLAEECKPAFLFLENVPAIRTRGGEAVGKELARLGFDCRWLVVSAAEVGAPHLRKRWFLLAAQRELVAAGELVSHSERLQLRDEQRWSGGQDREGPAFPVHNGETELVADPHSLRELQPEGGVSDIGGRAGDSHGRTTEPHMGGTSDGVPRRLDGSSGVGDGTEQEAEARAREVLSYVQSASVAEALQHATRGLGVFQAEEVLLSFVREYESGSRLPREFVAREATPEGLLRTMRLGAHPSCASLRRGPAEQYFREYTDALRELSHMVASRGETPWSNSLWEGGTPRVTEYAPSRADSLRSLGNAVVPAQAREAFVQLFGLKEQA